MLALQIYGVIHGLIWLGLTIRSWSVSKAEVAERSEEARKELEENNASLLKYKLGLTLVWTIWPLVYIFIVFKAYQDAKRGS